MNLVQQVILRIEDFPKDQQSWLGSLFTQLNPLFDSINKILNQNIDFSTNIPSVTQSYSIDSFQTFSMKWNFPDQRPAFLSVGSAYNVATQSPTVLMAAWSYDPSSRLITVSNMLEATVGGNVALTGKYTFNVRVSV
jgi:hypothetical protein